MYPVCRPAAGHQKRHARKNTLNESPLLIAAQTIGYGPFGHCLIAVYRAVMAYELGKGSDNGPRGLCLIASYKKVMVAMRSAKAASSMRSPTSISSAAVS